MGSIGEQRQVPEYDVMIIGAGLSGIFALHRMRGLLLKTRVLEAGSGEGGTWFWNRYPGFLDEWDWTEHFAPQPETLRYAQFLTDKFDLRKDMQFNTKISCAHWKDGIWLLTDVTGRTYSCRFPITAMGILNDPTLPNIPGWPEKWSLDGKRVGIIGTGATAIQIIPEIVRTTRLKRLTVFQRTANWSAPLRKDKIGPEEMVELRKQYPDILEACANSGAGFKYSLDTRKTMEVAEEDRIAHWEHLYKQRGFAKWLGAFADHLTDREANKAYSDFHAANIRGRVQDPVVAKKLIPKTHGFGTRRLPLETNYFEVYNLPNVRLVDFSADSPIERISPTGVTLANGEHIELDVLIYATGFDAITGALERGIDIRGRRGRTLSEVWEDSISTFLGLFVRDMPNMCMIMGPHQAFGHIPRSIEFAAESVTRLMKYCQKEGVVEFEAKASSVESWTDHVVEKSRGLLSNEVPSWLTGVNKNVKGKEKPVVARYSGTGPMYRAKVNDVADRNWEDLEQWKG